MSSDERTGIPADVPPWLAGPVESPGRRDFLAGFRRSRRGNLFHPLEDGGVAVVFKYKTGSKAGSFGWLIAREEWEKVFSPQGYTRQRDALRALAEELGY
jgi:hypothetical protein